MYNPSWSFFLFKLVRLEAFLQSVSEGARGHSAENYPVSSLIFVNKK